MTNDEGLMTKERRNPNYEKRASYRLSHLSIRASFVIRHSSFVINYTIARFAEFGIIAKRIESCRELGHLASKAVVENPRPLSPIETVPLQHCCRDHRSFCVYQRRAGHRGFAHGRRRAGWRQPMVRASGGVFLCSLDAVGRVQLVRLSGPALF